MKTIIIASISALLVATSATAQKLDIALDGGMQGLQYKMDDGKSQLKAGGGLTVFYSYPLSKKLDLQAGIGGGYYRTSATLKDGTVFSTNEIDETGSAFRHDITVNGYSETQHFVAFTVPVKVQYHSTGNTQWYVNGGAKFVFPLMAKFEASAKELSSSGYYPDFNIEVKDLPQHGFGTETNWNRKSYQYLNAGIAASGGAGMSFATGSSQRLYAGVYIDYGLTGTHRVDESSSLVQYNQQSANKSQPSGIIAIADKARLMAYGLQLRWEFSVGREVR